MYWKLDTPISGSVAGQPLELTHLANIEVNVNSGGKQARLSWETGRLVDGEWYGFSADNLTLVDCPDADPPETVYTDFIAAIDASNDTTTDVWQFLAAKRPELAGEPDE